MPVTNNFDYFISVQIVDYRTPIYDLDRILLVPRQKIVFRDEVLLCGYTLQEMN